MDRRSFIRLGVAGTGLSVVAPQIVLADVKAAAAPTYAGSVYYTKEAPGRWSKKVAGHLPNLEKQAGAGGKVIVRVTTGHEMKGYEHYIVKHMLFDEKMQFLGERMFDPMKEKAPISEYELSGKSGRVYAVSVCNKHDSWLNVIEV